MLGLQRGRRKGRDVGVKGKLACGLEEGEGKWRVRTMESKGDS